MADPPVPAFLIGGAPRSGTTALAHALDAHPDVVMARPFIPEPKVFMTPAPSIAAYLERYSAFFHASSPAEGAVLGEKTSYYLEHDAAREAIAAALPDVRVVFLVREPVDRAYSNWLWSRRNGLEDLPFEEAVAREGERPDPLPPERSYARPFDYLARGDYARFAECWFAELGRDRVRFWLYEDVIGDAAPRALAEIQEHVGVQARDLPALPDGLENAARDTGPPLDPAAAGRLRERTAPLVARFADLTGLDVARWGYA